MAELGQGSETAEPTRGPETAGFLRSPETADLFQDSETAKLARARRQRNQPGLADSEAGKHSETAVELELVWRRRSWLGAGDRSLSGSGDSGAGKGSETAEVAKARRRWLWSELRNDVAGPGLGRRSWPNKIWRDEILRRWCWPERCSAGAKFYTRLQHACAVGTSRAISSAHRHVTSCVWRHLAQSLSVSRRLKIQAAGGESGAKQHWTSYVRHLETSLMLKNRTVALCGVFSADFF